MAEGDGEGKLPHDIIGDQCLPLRVVCDERLKMSLQQIGCVHLQKSPRFNSPPQESTLARAIDMPRVARATSGLCRAHLLSHNACSLLHDWTPSLGARNCDVIKQFRKQAR